jgi:WD40 repeat protein
MMHAMFCLRRLCFALLLFGLQTIQLIVRAQAKPADPLSLGATAQIDAVKPQSQTDVQADSIAPASPRAMLLLKQHCFGCHNSEKKKAELILTSRDALLKGSENGSVIVVGKAAESRIAQVILPDGEPHMPPKNQLSDEEISILKTWIDQGATWDEKVLAESEKEILPEELQPLPSAYQPVLALALSRDDKKLAVARGNQIVVHETGATNNTIIARIDGHRDAVQSLAWSPDNKWLASGGFRGVFLWNAETMKIERVLTNLVGRITALTFSTNSAFLFIADGAVTKQFSILEWPIDAAEPKAKWKAHRDTIFDLQLSPNGQRLASAGADKLVKLWNLTNLGEAIEFEGHTGHVLGLAFKPDGTELASGGTDKEVKIWNVETKEQKNSIGRHSGSINDLAWPVEGKRIVTACDDGTIRLCEEAKNSPERTFPSVEESLYCVAVSNDGKIIYGGGHDGRVHVWKDGKLQAIKLGTTETTRVTAEK